MTEIKVKYQVRYPQSGGPLQVDGEFLLAQLADGTAAIFWLDNMRPRMPANQVVKHNTEGVRNPGTYKFVAHNNDKICLTWDRDEKQWYFQPEVTGLVGAQPFRTKIKLAEDVAEMFSCLLSSRQ